MSAPELPPQTRSKPLPHVGCILAVLFTVPILIGLMPCQCTSTLLRGQMVQTVNNGKQIYFATSAMVADGISLKDPNLGWPGDLASASQKPITSLAEFVKRLVESNYVNKADIGKIFAAPGIRAYTGQGEFTAANSGFKIYAVRQSDVGNVIFSATKNFTFGSGLDPNTSPYGEKAFAIIRKGGDATPFYNKQSALNRNLGLMPGHTNPEDPGTETKASILSM